MSLVYVVTRYDYDDDVSDPVAIFHSHQEAEKAIFHYHQEAEKAFHKTDRYYFKITELVLA